MVAENQSPSEPADRTTAFVRRFSPYTHVVSGICMVIGGSVQLMAIVFLLSALITGKIEWILNLPSRDVSRVLFDIVFFCKTLIFSSILFLPGIAYFRRRDGKTGYLVMLYGILLRWGVPMTMRIVGISSGIGSRAEYIVGHFETVGTIAFFFAIPVIMASYVRRIMLGKNEPIRLSATPEGFEAADNVLEFDYIPNAGFRDRITYYLIQMSYCVMHDILPVWRAVFRSWMKTQRYMDILLRLLAFFRKHEKTLSVSCLSLGGLAFIMSSSYLLWIILADKLTWMASLPQADAQGVLDTILTVNNILILSGILLLIGLSIRLRNDESTGYVMLALGVILYWGVPVAVYATLHMLSKELMQIGAEIVTHFRSVGTLCMINSVPFILLSFWYRVTADRGTEETKARSGRHIAPDGDRPAPSRVQLHCWQMSYCRLSLRRYCKAYSKRVSCWRIKCGCQCDDDAILRAMNKRTTATTAVSPISVATKQKVSVASTLSPEMKRQLCRRCFIYDERQHQKYRVIGPMVFPIVLVLEWLFYVPLRMGVHSTMNSLFRFTNQVSYTLWTDKALGAAGINFATGAADAVFILCLGLLFTAVLLRIVEYMVFTLKI